MTNHYFPTFKYRDVGRVGQFKWSRILSDEAEQYREKYINTDFCVSHARYADQDPTTDQPMLMGIVIDMDSADLETVLTEARSLRDYLYEGLGLRKEEAHFYYSGNRSIHIEVQPETLGIEPSDKLHLYIKEAIRRIADILELITIDYSLYARRHLVRCVGTQHSSTKRFKIEIDPSELNLSADEIQKLGEANRGSLYSDEDLNLSANDGASKEFHKLFNEAREIVDEYSFRGASAENLGKLKGTVKYPVCVQDLLENNIRVAGTRNRATLVLASFLKDIGKIKDEVIEILKPWAKAMPQELTGAKERERVEHVKDMASFLFSETGSDYHFACSYIRSLGDKTHPISCKPRCQLKVSDKDMNSEDDIIPITAIGISQFKEIGGNYVELVYDLATKEVQFAVYNPDTGEVMYMNKLTHEYPIIYFPKIDDNVHKGVVLFPSEATEYGNDEMLYKEIIDFIAKYYNETKKVYRTLNALYVMFTWVYDKFRSWCYVHLLGTFGGGKSRGLETIGYLSYRPIKMAGADSSACMFRMIDMYQGTTLIDEATFSKSSEAHNSIVQILNVGYKRGGSVGRCEGDDNHPVRYMVAGPKILATRREFDDDGLRSRCVVRRTGRDNRIKDGANKQPYTLPDTFEEEALVLRNKLLMWRFRHLKTAKLNPSLEIRGVESRLNEIIVPLLSIIDSPTAIKDIEELAREQQHDLKQNKQTSYEGRIIKIIDELGLHNGMIEPAEIKDRFNKEIVKEDKKIQTTTVTKILKGLEFELKAYGNKQHLLDSDNNKTLLATLLKDYDLADDVSDAVTLPPETAVSEGESRTSTNGENDDTSPTAKAEAKINRNSLF